MIAENFPNLGNDLDIQVHKVLRTPIISRPSPKHIIMKLSKRNDEKRILKAARGKGNRTYRGTLLGYQQIFQQKLQARREWNGTFKVLKKNC